MLIRFAFGASMGLIAGAVTLLFGAGAGGVFLASPATLLASLTLVAREEGLHSARDECRGATCGAVGLVAFGLLTAAGLGPLRWPAPLTLFVATVCWAAVGGLCYLVMRALIGDEDET
nr:DUF3147 family protein [Pseudonocardia acidicola]